VILHHEFIKSARKFPKNLAINDRTTGKQLTYSKTLIASIILSKLLGKYEDHHIGIMIPTSAGCFLTVIGTILAGKVPVMINYSTGAEQNCIYGQNKVGFKTIITSKALLDKIKCPIVPGMVFIEDLMKEITTTLKLRSLFRSKMPVSLLVKSYPADIDDTVVILFTSGSEKDPKAVQLTHRNIGSNIEDVLTLFNLTEDDTIMAILPLFHVFGYTVNFWLPMTRGMKAVTYANPLDYKTIPKIIREEKVTMIAGTPIFFSGYLRESEPGDFQSVKYIVPGADKTPEHLRQGFLEKHNKYLLEGYGATETSPVISVNTPDAYKPGSIGKPLPSVKVKIVDLATGKELPHGQEGKILVKGDLVMKGYFDDIEETSFRIKDGWYDTGDMGMLDEEGYLWHRGRLKRFVKIGGEMVSMVRTEGVLQNILPDDVDCCVVDVPDRIKGAKLVAAVTQKVDSKSLIKQMSKELPPIAIPNQFVVFEELPKMGSGKVDFRSITELVKKKLEEKSSD